MVNSLQERLQERLQESKLANNTAPIRFSIGEQLHSNHGFF